MLLSVSSPWDRQSDPLSNNYQQGTQAQILRTQGLADQPWPSMHFHFVNMFPNNKVLLPQ